MRLLSIVVFIGCFNSAAQSTLDQALHRIPGIDSILTSEKFQFECLLTEINPADIKSTFKTSRVGNSDDYYYPASTVKLPLALQILHNHSLEDSFYLVNPTVCGKYEYAANYHVGQLLKKMLVFSDNPSFNYLFEISGAGGMQSYMENFGIEGQVSRRLLHCKRRFWRRSNITNLYSAHRRIKYKGSFRHGLNARLGSAHYYGGKFYEKPRNFKTHNYLPLKTDHDILRKLFFTPDSLGISQSAKDTLIHYLRMTPQEYGDTTKPDAYTKYLFMGKDSTDIPDNIQITNIVGRAYGYMIDHAHIRDMESGIEFIVSARIYVNENDILGDDIYQYDTIAFPIFKSLGRNLLQIMKESRN